MRTFGPARPSTCCTADAIEVERYNRLHPLEENKLPFVTSQLQGHEGPVVAATDYVRSFADRIRAYIPNDYHVLGTDGFGRSDSRANLRSFFEVDRYNIAVTALSALADQAKSVRKRFSKRLRNTVLKPIPRQAGNVKRLSDGLTLIGRPSEKESIRPSEKGFLFSDGITRYKRKAQ